jgi:hypothetical protein
MKTPRQILFERHRAVETKLDAVRESVIGSMSDRARVKAAAPPERVRLRDLILSLRWHLTALSAAWLIVLLLNTEPSTSLVASVPLEKIPAPRELLASAQAYSRQLVELLERPAAEPAVAPPRRSQFRAPWEVV